MSSMRIHLLDGFDDPGLNRLDWRRLLSAGDTDTVFQTWEWQRTWWDVFGRGKLLLLVAEHDGQAVACAPLFCDEGMVFFVGSGGSDYLDFVGDVGPSDVLPAMLDAVRGQAPGFVGFRFYHVPDRSHTGRWLKYAAAILGMICYDEGELAAPALTLAPDVLRQTIRKQSLVRHENFFRRTGLLTVQHFSDGGAIRAQLEEFFDQHVARWADTGYPSLFSDPRQRQFYARIAETAGEAGWLRFTRLEWQDRPIAFHFGFCYHGSYLWYKPSFDIALARNSPGEVLIRQLLLAADAEGACTFDLGLGDEPFKDRFADHVEWVRTWGLYPEETMAAQPARSEGA